MFGQSQERGLQEALAWLTGRRHKKGEPITHELLAKFLGVSLSTVARWAAGAQTSGDRLPKMQLIWLYHQSKIWYAGLAPFILMMWEPGEDLRNDEERGLIKHHQDFFSEVAFAPTRASPVVVECRLKLAVDLERFVLAAHGANHLLTRFGYDPDPGRPGSETIAFDRKLRSPLTKQRPALKKGEVVKFFIKYPGRT